MKFLKRFYIALVFALALPVGFAFATYPNIAIWDNDQLSTLGHGSITTAVDTSGTITLNAATTSTFSFTLTSTGRTLTIVNPRPGQVVDLYVTQDATGNRTITTYTNGYWAGGSGPTLTTTAAAVDVLRATWNATLGKWFYETVGKAYS